MNTLDRPERPLKILFVADSKIAIPPEGYGGVERVIGSLAEEFAKRGHHVALMGKHGSKNYGRLRTYGWAGKSFLLWRLWCRLQFFLLAQIETYHRPDYIIAFGRIDYLGVFLRSGIPMLYQFQNPIHDEQVSALVSSAKGPLTMAALTRSHMGNERPGNWVVLPNPVNIENLRYNPTPKAEYLAFLGRLTQNKGVDTAINIAERTGMPLKIAGNISDEPGDKAFFETEVRPRLTDTITWIGEIDDTQKSEFLGNASALLMPIRWPEPFGIVVAESLACGTPVIATRCGSMPELIDAGVTGFLANDEDEMVALVARIKEIDRGNCRAIVERRFSQPDVANAFLEVLKALSKHRSRATENQSDQGAR